MYLGGVRIGVFPKYAGDSTDRFIVDNLLAQRALWSALQLLFVASGDYSVELRIVSRREDGSIAVYLLLRGTTSEPDVALRLFRQLLPREYVWVDLTAEESDAALEPSPGAGGPWRIARMIRRLQYIDLPSYLPPGAAADESRLPVSPRLRLDLGRGADRRRLPDDRHDFAAELESTTFCLPLVTPLEEAPSSDRRPLWEELQTSAPAVISVTLSGFSRETLDLDRQVATRLRGFVEYLATPLANAGFSHLTGLRTVFDRYFLNSGHVGIATARVAATNDAAAMAVAQQFCAWIGAMRAFAVLPPTRSFDRLEPTLADLSVDLPPDNAREQWDSTERRLRRTLDGERIDLPEDERYLPFLIRLPHVFSLDEIGLLFRLPFGFEPGLPGLSTRLLPPFYGSTQQFQPVRTADRYAAPDPDRIRIGRLNPRTATPLGGSDHGLQWHSIPKQDFTKHALIVGSTGSGKTVTTLFLMRELARLRVPFLVIEPVKTEYFSSLKDLPELRDPKFGLKRYRLEGTPIGTRAVDYLPFDPLRLQPGVTVARHVSYLKSCFEAAFPMEAWQALFVENALLDYYVAPRGKGGCGLSLFRRGGPGTVSVQRGPGGQRQVFPSFETFSRYFLGTFLERELGKSGDGARPSDRIEEFRQVFKRRFENLARGPLGEAFRKADWLADRYPGTMDDPFPLLLQGPTVIELDAVPDGDQKSLLMAFLMTFLFERRQVDDLLAREAGRVPDSSLRHVLVIEEAHRLLANPAGGRRGESVGQDSKAKAVSLFVDMLAEIRAFGQGIVVVEQIPTKLVPEAVKNTNLKIMLRLTASDDRDFLGEAMSFNDDQKRFVNTLRAERGQQVQFVAFDENVDQPVLLSMPLKAVSPSGRLFDEYFVTVSE